MSCEKEELLIDDAEPTSPGNGDLPDSQECIDFDIHGIVGVRLLDCPPTEAAAISRKLACLRRPLLREPDIVVRFVKHLETPGLRHLGLRQYGFTDDDFFLIAEKTGRKTKICFEQVGSSRCEIVAETGAQVGPVLTALINVTALKKNYVSLHASAFCYDGVGVLVAGWKKGGKTESLLSFAARGASYIGDEWILVSGDGQRMCGLPGLIPVWDWHFRYLPELRRQVSVEDRLFFRAVGGLAKLERALPAGKLGNLLPIRLLRDALPWLKRRTNVAFDPEMIFTPPLGPLSARLDKIILSMSHKDQDIRVEPANVTEVAARMTASLEFEQLSFFQHYLAFKFAFPERSAYFMERVAEMQSSTLSRALAGKEAYLVSHPYPVPLAALGGRMLPLCEAAAVKPYAQFCRQLAISSVRKHSA